MSTVDCVMTAHDLPIEARSGVAHAKRMLRVALDVSILKHGAAADSRRSGLFRVTEGLVTALAHHPHCDLVLLVPQSYRALLHVQAYLTATRSDARRHLVVPAGTAARARLEEFAARWSDPQRRDAVFLELGGRAIQKLTGGSGSEFAARQASACDVFHSPAYPLPASTARPRVRVLTCHDVLPIRRPDLFEPAHIAFVKEILQSIRREDHVICVSQATAADFQELTGHPADRVHVVHSAADRELFHQVVDSERLDAVATKYGIRTPYILSVGTLEPRKNLAHVIRAFAAMLNQQPAANLTLVIVGGAGWGSDVGKLIADDPATARHIVRTGYVPDADLAPLYSGASAFVYMSLFEGFGLPLLEAMQCGTPVIGSNIAALREVADDAGTLLDPRDVEGLAGAMWRLHRHATERAIASRAALQRAVQFTWQRSAEAVMRTYEIALAS